jgi:hypothetical protein
MDWFSNYSYVLFGSYRSDYDGGTFTWKRSVSQSIQRRFGYNEVIKLEIREC